MPGKRKVGKNSVENLVSFTIEGVDETKRRIEAELDAVEEKLIALIEETIDKVVKDAKTLVPVDTGYLRDTMYKEMFPKKRFGRVKTNFPAHLIEFGWKQAKGGRMMPAKPFLVPALEMHRNEFDAKVKQILEDFRLDK